MITNDIFLNKLLSTLDCGVRPEVNNFLICLKVMLKHMGLSINFDGIDNITELNIENFSDYEKDHNLILYPVSYLSMADLKNCIYPILIQSEKENDFYVVINNKKNQMSLFNPISNTFEKIDPQTKITISKAWQCCPIKFPVCFKYIDLLKNIFLFFKKDVLKSVGLSVVVASTPLLISMIAGFIFENLHEINQKGSSIIFLAFFIFLLSFSVISYVNDLYIKSLSIKILFFTLPSIWNHIYNLPINISKKYLSGDLVQRVLDYEVTLSSMITLSLSMLLDLFALILLMLFMLSCNCLLAFLYLAICIAFSALKMAFLPKNISHITNQFFEQGRVSSLLNEILLQINKIRSASAEKIVFSKWLHNLIAVKKYEEKSMRIQILIFSIESLVPIFLLSSLYIIFFSSKNAENALLFIPFIVCAGQFSGIFEKLSAEIVSLIQFMPGLKRMEILFDENQELSVNKIRNFKVNGDILFSNVYLRDKESGGLILEDITLEIKAGSFVALIGSSGAGKSSLFKLLLDFESPSSGIIAIDKENIKNINMKDIRKQFGVVLQTTNILPGTIFSNIAANTSITLNTAWQLAKYVGLDEEIEKMPMKMYTHISDNAGESISGGQKQKILIARALATNPKLLLLDEATSALDNTSQSLIYQNLKSLNLTRFVIAHRHSTIIDADIIYVMQKGRIIEKGTYMELVHKNIISSSLNTQNTQKKSPIEP